MKWWDPETTCGVGSTMAFTAGVRGWLPGALERLEANLLLDAPCGDRNWIRVVDLPCGYIGVDHEPDHVAKARFDDADVRLLDIRTDPLPPCDVILSRDFFQHLSWADAELALENMRKTGAEHIIATCHGKESADIKTGDFRFVFMSKWMGDEPIDMVSDGKDGRVLGVWRL